MIDHLLSIVAPHSCCNCRTGGSILCSQCKYDIISEPFSRCLACLRPTSRSELCGPCRQSTKLADAWCVGERKGALKILLDRYKFDATREVASVAAALLDARLPMLPAGCVVTAVPTASSHRRARGFDHMALIAKKFAKLRGVAYVPLLRTTNNETQHFKSRADRLRRTTKDLQLAGTPPPTILLIDDIYTTGTTFTACARTLRRNGCSTLYGAIIARQTLDGQDDLW